MEENQMEGMGTEKLYRKRFGHWWRGLRDMKQNILVLRRRYWRRNWGCESEFKCYVCSGGYIIY